MQRHTRCTEGKRLHQVKKRYLAFKVESHENLSQRDLMNAVWDVVYRLFGEVGASQTGLSFVKYDEKTKVLILRCSHKAIDVVRAATAAITAVKGNRAVLCFIAVSGTLKALRKKLLKLSEGHTFV